MSIKKKLGNLNLPGLVEGVVAKATGRNQELAEQRAKICQTCDQREDEPIAELAISDDIPAISGKMCGACGCALPYLLRQNRKKCKLGKW